MPGDSPGDGTPPVDARAGLPPDERALLEAFDRLAPQGTLRWNFDDAVRRLAESTASHGRLSPWGGLPPDLWERGRSTKASERVLGDVVKIVAQDLSEYTDRAVAESARLGDESLARLRGTTFDAVRFLSARVDRLERALDPLGIAVGELDLAAPDTSSWIGPIVERIGTDPGQPVVVGELGDLALLRALTDAGIVVDAVDPRGATVWAAEAEVAGDRVTLVLDEVVQHLRTLAPASRSAVVLSGCVDRASLVGNVDLVDEAVRVVGPGGTVALLVTDPGAWAADLGPVIADLLPGRPLHPETWRLVLAHRGASDAEWMTPGEGSVHAVVAEVGG